MLGCSLFELLSGGVPPFLDRPCGGAEFRGRHLATPQAANMWEVKVKTWQPNWAATARWGGPRSPAAVECCSLALMKRPQQRPSCVRLGAHRWFEEQRQVGSEQ